MMAGQKLPDCCVEVSQARYLCALHLGLFEVSLRSLIRLAICIDDFLRFHQILRMQFPHLMKRRAVRRLFPRL